MRTKNTNMCLFDMDGTLTPARMSMPPKVLKSLKNLSKCADIGIVSGSPLSYIKEQVPELLEYFYGDCDGSLLVMPCNGTQLYKINKKNNKLDKTFSADMKKELGYSTYLELISLCNDIHRSYIESGDKIPVAGNFASYRGSLLNFCPPGRDASELERDLFVEWDLKNSGRTSMLETMQLSLANLGIDNVTCSLGGNTSIDIYPSGWDKTYCLQHVSNYHLTTFVGDKCEKTGNDYTIYNHLLPLSYKTESTDETVEIINTRLIPICRDGIYL